MEEERIMSGTTEISSMPKRQQLLVNLVVVSGASRGITLRVVRSMPQVSRASVQTFVEVRRAPSFHMSVIDLSAAPAGPAGSSCVFRAFAAHRRRPLKSG